MPFADVGPLKVDDDLTDDQVLFLSDILPTGYMGAEMCDIKAGDVVAVWGAGPVGLFAMVSALLLGASEVIAIDQVPYRLELAQQIGCDAAELGRNVGTRGVARYDGRARTRPLHRRGRLGSPQLVDRVDAYDRVKQAVRLETERPHALREAG